MIIQNATTRRSFLKSATACLALPYLDTFAEKQHSPANKRMIFLSQGYGFVNSSFYPKKAGKFSQIGLTEGLKNLKEHQNDVTLLENLVNVGVSNPHLGSSTLLTGAASAQKNTVSCDQVAAKFLCKDTRYSSLILSTTETGGGHGGVRSLSWNQIGKPMDGLTDSMQTYSALFSNNEDRQSIIKRIKDERSILDDLKINIKSITKNIALSDKDKLDEYFQTIRQIELNLQKELEWSSIPKPKASFKLPKEEIDGETEVKLMLDLLLIALQTEQTRVASYMMPSKSVLTSMGIQLAVHSLSHYNVSSERTEAAKRRDSKCIELFSYLLSKLKSTKDRQGKSLYDSTTICYGTNIRSKHTIKGMPMFLSGGGIKKLRLGESLFLPKDTPLQNVWLTLLQENGIPINKFSSSTGSLPHLLT